jgi:hypothetical protein
MTYVVLANSKSYPNMLVILSYSCCYCYIWRKVSTSAPDSWSLWSHKQHVTSKHVAPLGDNDDNDGAFFVLHCIPLDYNVMVALIS